MKRETAERTKKQQLNICVTFFFGRNFCWIMSVAINRIKYNENWWTSDGIYGNRCRKIKYGNSRYAYTNRIRGQEEGKKLDTVQMWICCCIGIGFLFEPWNGQKCCGFWLKNDSNAHLMEIFHHKSLMNTTEMDRKIVQSAHKNQIMAPKNI